jgi:3-methyladenine DNA glycosylase AlkD
MVALCKTGRLVGNLKTIIKKDMLEKLKGEMQKLADKKKAKLLSGFFKTGKGEYGEGDLFLGIVVPNQRIVAKQFTGLSLPDLEKLLHSRYHEHRLTALLIIVQKFKKADDVQRENIIKLYLKNYAYINNWDLVDLTAPETLGAYLVDKDRRILYVLANSDNLWKKRIAILSTFKFIKNKEFKDAIKISKILLNDKHDLIHKAVGWMLREVGKRDQQTEEKFLRLHYQTMPRTMLRYAIEKFPEEKRQFYLNKPAKNHVRK